MSCMLFSVKSSTPERFGTIKWGQRGQVIDIIEKPKEFVSNDVVVGIYLYEPKVFEVIKTLSRSERGELEISDVNRHYVSKGQARVESLSGWWSDCGSIETLLKAEEMIRNGN